MRSTVSSWGRAAGTGRRDAPRLVAGDKVGFWEVLVADHRARRLVLQAHVRAPGTVTLEATATPHSDGAAIGLAVTFRPRGLLGRGYLLADLPARGLVTELAMLDLLTVLRRHITDDDNRSATGPVHQS